MPKRILFINRTDRTFLIEKMKEYFAFNKIDAEIICGSNVQHASSNTCADHFELIPEPFSEGYKEAILNTVRKHIVCGIFAASNFDLLPLTDIKNELEELGANVVVSSKKVIDNCLNKVALSRSLNAHNISTPETFVFEKLMEKNDLPFPLVIKPATGQGSTETYIVHHTDPEVLKSWP